MNVITTEKEKDVISSSAIAIAPPDAPSHGSSHDASNFSNDILPPDIVSWFSSTAQTRASHAAASKPKSLGVSYQDLNVYGFRTTSDYHHTVDNYPLRLASVFTTQKSRNDSKVNILRGFDGVVRSGEMLLVLGRPGSGCSTFLKTLAGEMHGIYLGAETKLNYQGISSSQMRQQFRGEYIYTAEQDHHFPELTVGETLEFAASCREPSYSSADKASKGQYANSMKEALLSAFNLWGVVDSKLGNDVVRGVSGGERKRVTIAESLLGWAPFQCWDNSTRGLDSATALRFVQVLRAYTTSSEAAAAVSLYQASQAIYDTFDKVVVLYQGRQIYFGLITSAVAYFEKLGFVCPDHVTTADFLSALTHPPEARSFVREGHESRIPRCADDFARLWYNSVERQRVMENIRAFDMDFAVNSSHLWEFEASRRGEKATSLSTKSAYTIAIPRQVMLCTTRAFKRLRNNLGVPIGTAVGNVVMAIIVGSVFFNLEETTESFFNRGILIFFAVLLNGCMGAFEVLTIWAQRPIIEKHSRYALYHPFTDAAAAMLCDLPNKIITSVCFNVVLYFMTNLRRSPAAFFIWLLFSFACFVTMSMFFRMVGSLSRTITATMAPVAITILMYIAYTGFVIPAAYMQPWLGWCRYVNPIGFAFESLMVNEFRGRTFPCKSFVPAGPMYANVTLSDKICAVVGAHPGEAHVAGNDYLKANFGYHSSHLWRNLGIIIAMGIAFCSVHLVASEYIVAERSKGEVLLFLRGQQPKGNSGQESESEFASHFPFEQSPTERPRPSLPPPLQLHLGSNVPFYWDNLSYEIKVNKSSRRILNSVEGWVKPRTLTALMGATGAGKTTLLDVLANRASQGTISGEVLINGQPLDADSQRRIGYVQQQDIHLATTTVREALEFSALLRQSRQTSKHEKLEFVDHIVRLLEMESFQNAIVGVPGLNVEQRKRLSIGVEMAAKPELLLFLDEPTSGLDSQTSWSICKLLGKLANNGHTILCTIHQPSAQLLQEFDNILLLGPQGKTHYFGKVRDMIQYFERRGAPRCGPRQNPADWVMSVTGAAPGAQTQLEWASLWEVSDERKIIKDHLVELKVDANALHGPSSSSSSEQFAASFGSQLDIVTRRAFRDYWRMPTYIWSRFFLCVGSAFFIGFSFWDSPNSLQGLQNLLFSVFLLLMVFSQVVQQLIPQFIQARTLYEAREGPSKTYDWKVFVLSSILVELPWQTLMSILAFITWYFPIGFQHGISSAREGHERAGLMCAFFWVFYLFCSTFATLVIAAVEQAETGVNLANLFYYLTLIFCGVLVKPTLLPRFWIFMYRVSPLTYLVSGMFSAGVAHKTVSCSATELIKIPIPQRLYSFGTKPTCGMYLAPFLAMAGGRISNPDSKDSCLYCPVINTDSVLQDLGIYYEDRWRNFGLMWVYVVFNVLGALLLYWLARIPKNRKR